MEKTFNYSNITIEPSQENINIYYFSDGLDEEYWVVDLENTDDFLAFCDYIDDKYDSTISNKIHDYFDRIFEEIC